MNSPNKKELIIGIAMLAASLAYLVMAQQLPGHAGIDAATVPKLLAGFLSLLGLMQVVSAFARPKAAAEPVSYTHLDVYKRQLRRCSPPAARQVRS